MVSFRKGREWAVQVYTFFPEIKVL